MAEIVFKVRWQNCTFDNVWQVLKESVGEIPMEGKVVIVVGGTKVPGELFGIADYNSNWKPATL